MVDLHLIGALDRCPTLPDQLDLRALARSPTTDVATTARLEEQLAVARLRGDRALQRALRSALRGGTTGQRARKAAGRAARRIGLRR
jgi:hypothetical protein